MLRALALILTVLTGFSGLVYEVTWQKGLAILLGSHSEATAAVLALFLGGLSLGYSVFGRVSSRMTASAGPGGVRGRLLLVYGAVEASIGVWAIAWPYLFEAARALSIALSVETQALSFTVDLLLTTLLIGPPAVLMGGTIPLLTQALARDLEDATRFHASVYGFNTLGAFGGALAGGFFLIPWLGIPTTLAAMGLVNLVVGGSFALLCRTARAGAPATTAPPPAAELASFPLFATAALLLGFAMMALQTALIRVGGLALGASHFSFAMVVATFVLCIAIGSLAVSARQRIPTWVVAACPLALGLLLCALFPLIELAPYAAHVLRSLFQSIDQAFYPFYFSASLGILVVFALPLGLSGASLPLIFHALRNEMGELGGLAGRIYGWNTLGSLLGSLLGGYVLLHWLDLHHIYRIAVAAILVAWGLLAVRVAGTPRIAAAAFACLAIAGTALLPPWNPRQLSAGYFRQRTASEATWQGPDALLALRERRLGSPRSPVELRFYDDDPISTVAVIEYSVGNQRTLGISTNGKNDGSLLVDYPTMALAGLIPCLMAERCQKAFVIGLGTGVTAGELAGLDGMQRVLVGEISPGVIEAAPLFDRGNRGASKNAKIEVVRSDAFRALLHNDERWDVIASEPSNPWVAGVEMLFSQEFLAAARDRLAPGGVYAQWMHTYELDDATLELVLRSYASVFDRVGVWYTYSRDLLLLGFADARSGPDLDRISERFERPDLQSGLRRSGIASLEELLAHELVPVGLVTRAALPGEVHTLLHPRLSQRAAHAFFTGGSAKLPYLPQPAGASAQPSLLQQLRGLRGPESEETRSRVVRHVCESRPQECAVLLARWQHDAPDSARLRETLAQERAEAGNPEALEQRNLELMASLFGVVPERLGPERVRAATEIFFGYYHPAEPFRAETLRSLWRLCVEPECARLRPAWERRLDAIRERAEARSPLRGDRDA
jgi:predicted membrane-bound spermidine synthase